MTSGAPTISNRRFGFSVGTLLAVAAALFAWRGRMTAADGAASAAFVLLALGTVRPSWLAVPHAIVRRAGLALAYVNTRVFLTLAYALILTPLGVLWRLVGTDPLSARRASARGWVPSPERLRARDHFERMF